VASFFFENESRYASSSPRGLDDLKLATETKGFFVLCFIKDSYLTFIVCVEIHRSIPSIRTKQRNTINQYNYHYKTKSHQDTYIH
jgi:hypothetical protein